MKLALLFLSLALLTGCFRQSSVVTVGQNRTAEPNTITDYSFYSHEFVEFFDALPAQERRKITAVSKVSDNTLRFSFRSMTKNESDSEIAGLFHDFVDSRYKERYERWEQEKHEILKPFIELAERDPDVFKKRAIDLISMPLRPTVEVYILRVE